MRKGKTNAQAEKSLSHQERKFDKGVRGLIGQKLGGRIAIRKKGLGNSLRCRQVKSLSQLKTPTRSGELYSDVVASLPQSMTLGEVIWEKKRGIAVLAGVGGESVNGVPIRSLNKCISCLGTLFGKMKLGKKGRPGGFLRFFLQGP